MSDNKNPQQSQADAELEREIRKGQKFTVAEAIGRMAGPGAMKGVSPVTRMKQATVEIDNWLGCRMLASDGPLQVVTLRQIERSEILLRDFEQPLSVLTAFCRSILDSEYLLKELVREADVEWGQSQNEKPHFETEGVPPNPDDPYTSASVRKTLAGFLEQLAAGDTR